MAANGQINLNTGDYGKLLVHVQLHIMNICHTSLLIAVYNRLIAVHLHIQLHIITKYSLCHAVYQYLAVHLHLELRTTESQLELYNVISLLT